MKERYFVGDIHGSIKALEHALSKVDLTQEVYFVGDYVDRGYESCQVLEKLCSLSKEHPTLKCLKGNHDVMFLDFIYSSGVEYLHQDRVLSTLKSFFPGRGMFFDGFANVVCSNTYEYITEEIREALKGRPEVKWLMNLPFYEETENQIIVHAGIDKELDCWKNTPEDTMVWIRPSFSVPNNTGKTIICGHTPTFTFSSKNRGEITEQADIYFSKNTNEIFIDTLNFYFDKSKVLKYSIDTDEYSCL